MKRFLNAKFILILVFLLSIATIVPLLLPSSFRVYAKEKITIIDFKVPTNQSVPYDIVAGPDGNLWFTEIGGNKIGKITPTGKITEFQLTISSPDTTPQPYGITSGPDGNLWFTEFEENKIGKITPTGIITEFLIPTDNSAPFHITAGPDGNLWFTEANTGNIGRITPSGIVTEFPAITGGNLVGITAGSDGNLWFTESAKYIGRITPTGIVTEFSLSSYDNIPSGITVGSDGNVWFTEVVITDVGTSKIGRITPEGIITEFTLPASSSDSRIVDITAGQDGNLWFIRSGFNMTDESKIGWITTSGDITEFPLLTVNSDLGNITAGPDGNIWFTEPGANKIGRVNLSDQHEPDRDLALLSPFNNRVTWTVSSGYYNNRNQTSTGCHIGTGPDHCRNQLFGLDMVPDQQSDKKILAPGNGKVSFKGKLEGGCVGLRITLDNGLNLNVCHFATWNVSTGDRVLRGKVLGTRSTSHVHLSLDNRYKIGTLCKGPDRCFLPVPFDGQHTIEGMVLDPDPNGETVTLPYSLCNQRKNISCQFKVRFQQNQGLKGTSSNIAIP